MTRAATDARPERGWQLPISAYLIESGKRRAHLFELSQDTHRLVAAACGREVNPGFAEPAGVLRCRKCERAAGRTA